MIFKRRIRTLEHGPERISDIVNEPTIIIPVGIHLPVVGTGKTAAESRIVHGKGTGALRNGVTAYLRGVPYIKSFRLGEIGEGDAGVTIVDFK